MCNRQCKGRILEKRCNEREFPRLDFEDPRLNDGDSFVWTCWNTFQFFQNEFKVRFKEIWHSFNSKCPGDVLGTT